MKFSGDEHTQALLWVYAILISVIGIGIGILSALQLTAWFWIPTGIWIPLSLFFCWWFPPRFTSRLHGTFDGQVIFAQMGVLVHRNIFIPHDALRNFELLCPPVHAVCGCSTMLLRFAGGTVVLPF